MSSIIIINLGASDFPVTLKALRNIVQGFTAIESCCFFGGNGAKTFPRRLAVALLDHKEVSRGENDSIDLDSRSKCR